MIGVFSGARGRRLVPLLILAASLGALAIAYVAQYAFGLEPCVLCLYQRGPYAVAAALAVLVVVWPLESRRDALAIGLCGLAFLIGAGLAVYHVGVEQHWWVSAAACGAAPAVDISPDEMRAQLLSPPAKPCDAVDWTFLGLSMAAYNAVASLALAAGSLAGARLLLRQAE